MIERSRTSYEKFNHLPVIMPQLQQSSFHSKFYHIDNCIDAGTILQVILE